MLSRGIVVSAGDWASVGQLLSSQGMGGFYDIILTAETIYNEDSQQRLLDCVKQVRTCHSICSMQTDALFKVCLSRVQCCGGRCACHAG
jgi:hypothetical protein